MSMWSSVEDELATMLSTRVFHTLAGDSGYVELFRKAGFKGDLATDPRRAPTTVRQRLRIAARVCAQLLRMDVASKNSLRERRAKAVVVEGNISLYRLWSAKDNDRIGPWWFTANPLCEALTQSDNDRRKAVEWLRDRLAISIDFGACDRVAALTLGLSSALPAIEAWGLPMPQYTPKALEKDPKIPLPEYFSKRQRSFQGQKTQYFLPFIPLSRVTDYW
jgi:hypothetical protein